MEIQVLKQDIKTAIRKDVHLKAKLASFNNIGIWALDQWRLKDNPMLTTLDNLAIIRKHLDLPENDVLTEPMEVKPAGKPELKVDTVHT